MRVVRTYAVCVCVCACVCVCVCVYVLCVRVYVLCVCVRVYVLCVCVWCVKYMCVCVVCVCRRVCIKEPHFDSLGLGQMQTHSTLDQLSHSCPIYRSGGKRTSTVTTRSSKNEANVLSPIQSISGCLSHSGKMKIQTDQPYSMKLGEISV